jgi:hypothetical protein
MYMELASAGLSLYQAHQANEEAKLRNKLRKKQAEINNQTRQIGNAESIETNKLQRWVQNRNNQLAAQSVGSALEANTVNAARSSAKRTRAQFTSAVGRAEQMGQQAAQTAFSGVTGSVTQVVAGTMALRDSIAQEAFRRAGVTEITDTARRAGAIMSQLANAQDLSILNPRMDYNTDIPELEQEKGTWDLLREQGAKSLQSYVAGQGGVADATAALGKTAAPYIQQAQSGFNTATNWFKTLRYTDNPNATQSTDMFVY